MRSYLILDLHLKITDLIFKKNVYNKIISKFKIINASKKTNINFIN